MTGIKANAERALSDLYELRRIGTFKTGVHRPTLSPQDMESREWLANKLRGLKGQDLEEGVSTRLVVYAATLIAQGMSVDRAVRAAMIEPLTDDEDIKRGLFDLVTAVFG